MQDAKVHRCQCPCCADGPDDPEHERHAQLNLLLSRCDEQQRRWWVAWEANYLGHGGVALMSLVTGLHPETIRRGQAELAAGLAARPRDRVRLPGAGRPPVEKKTPEVRRRLKAIVEPETGGDPQTGRRFVRLSLREVGRRLGHAPGTVARLLDQLGFSLRVNVKRFTGPPHPDRDRQFRYLRRQRQAFLRAGDPVLSVDTKKKELIGRFKNPGRTWRRTPHQVNVHDFIQDAACRAVPYGIYDLTHRRGHVHVGTSTETPQFAVDALRHWWHRTGRRCYAGARRLLIEADAGGSNGCRPRLWKRALQQWADAEGLTLTVAHYPAGASKWNPIEHRLFGPISINWAGEPLSSLTKMLGLIRGTRTRTGLRVTASCTHKRYPAHVRVSNQEFDRLNLRHHATCPNWNYTIGPRAP